MAGLNPRPLPYQTAALRPACIGRPFAVDSSSSSSYPLLYSSSHGSPLLLATRPTSTSKGPAWRSATPPKVRLIWALARESQRTLLRAHTACTGMPVLQLQMECRPPLLVSTSVDKFEQLVGGDRQRREASVEDVGVAGYDDRIGALCERNQVVVVGIPEPSRRRPWGGA